MVLCKQAKLLQVTITCAASGCTSRGSFLFCTAGGVTFLAGTGFGAGSTLVAGTGFGAGFGTGSTLDSTLTAGLGSTLAAVLGAALGSGFFTGSTFT